LWNKKDVCCFAAFVAKQHKKHPKTLRLNSYRSASKSKHKTGVSMASFSPLEAIQRTVTVQTSLERAFDMFAAGLSTWWPKEYTWAGEGLDLICIEPRVSGRCFERGPNNFECDWGRVLVYEHPHRIVFTWQISPTRVPVPDSNGASEVEVRFSSAGADVTQVELEHRGFERHGEGADEYRAAMDSPEGWTYILDRFRAAPG
jgi:uncharacterized protein YndB with AHSA1/START domain